MTSRVGRIAGELAALFGKYPYGGMAHYFESLQRAMTRAEGDLGMQKQIARDLLSDYRGMGSLNDVVVMIDGRADIEVNAELARLLAELRTEAIEVATGRD